MIKINDVTFNYGAQEEHSVPPVLHHINLQIHEGETVAIVGHNGSGKSTLAKLIAAILHPHSGSIHVDGIHTNVDSKEIWTIRQRVGIVFQEPDDQLVANTVIDDIAFGPENLGLPRQEIEERVQEVLALLHLTEFAQMSISDLPVSLKQRVAIAGVLAMRPRYLVLDEPTTMLSDKMSQQLMETIQQLSREKGVSVLHITHFMHEITKFDRVIVMDTGQVLMDGTPAEVFARADELQKVGLDVPLQTHLGNRLMRQGRSHLAQVVLSAEQLLADDTHNSTSILSIADATELSTQQNSQVASLANQPSWGERTEKQSIVKAAFTLKDVLYTHQYGTPFAQKTIHGLTLSIPMGQITAIIGPTNAGKSTLIDLLSGLVKPQSGAVFFDSINIAGSTAQLAKVRAQVGIVFQSPEAQIFEETVGKDVSFGPRQQKKPLAESRRLVQESLEAVGLPYEDFRSRYTYALSGGQKRRVAIAGVLALQPKIIIFDEPMSGLDPRGRRELLNLITALKQHNKLTIIYASSSLQDVVEIADLIYVLDNGRLALSGTPREILTHADSLQALDVTLPEAVQVALKLRQRLPTLRTNILTSTELEAELLSIVGTEKATETSPVITRSVCVGTEMEEEP